MPMARGACRRAGYGCGLVAAAVIAGGCAAGSRTVGDRSEAAAVVGGGGAGEIRTLAAFLANRPPGDFLAARRLVPADRHAPEIRPALEYTRARNVVGRPLYPADMPCLLDADTAKKLGKAQDILRKSGLGLLVWDAYRPTAVQRKLFAAAEGRAFVANPDHGFSRHASGRAVDVTLYDLDSGRELPMPSGFDDFSERASSNYRGGDPRVARNLGILRDAMKAAGFIGIEMEWWHYENAEFQHYDIPPFDEKALGIRLPD